MKNHSIVKPVSGILLAIILALTLVTIPAAGNDGIVISLPEISASAGTVAIVPVSIQNAEELSGVQMEITYDPALLEFVSVEPGEISQNGIVEASEPRPGTISIAMTDSSGISRDGNLLKVSFKVKSTEVSSSPLGITTSRITNLDGNDVPAQVKGGNVLVSRAGGQAAPLPVLVPVLAMAIALGTFLRRRREEI